jgi:NADH-quinone oxidoreductase subunit E
MSESHLAPDVMTRAREIVALYPHPRSALIPLCHLAQEQDGWLTPGAMADIADLVGVTPAEVLGTATFYDMLHTEEVGTYVVAVCTNIACMLRGAYELLDHAEKTLGTRTGSTTADGVFTLEDAECLADCGRAPCLQVNHRFFGDVTPESFETLVDDLRSGRLDDDVPHHGTLVRVQRDGGLRVADTDLRAERAAMASAMAERAAASAADGGAGGAAKGGS